MSSPRSARPLSATSSAATTTESPKSASEVDPTTRRRQQCRRSQRRYRDKQGSTAYNLQLDVNGLQSTVMRLTEAKTLLETKIWSNRSALNGSIMKAVEQYMVVLRSGLHNPLAGVTARKCYDIQCDFLRTFMTEDVLICGVQGVENMVEQWRLYTDFHASIGMVLNHAEIMGTQSSVVVKAMSTCTVRINRRTLENMFPAALEDEDLVQRLIGQQCKYAVCSIYVFDEKNQVARYDAEIDFLAGLSAVVGSSRQALEVMRSARIRESVLVMRPTDDTHTDAHLDAVGNRKRGSGIDEAPRQQQHERKMRTGTEVKRSTRDHNEVERSQHPEPPAVAAVDESRFA